MLILINDLESMPIECEAGLYRELTELNGEKEAAAFMVKYRLLPHYVKGFPERYNDKNIDVCMDPRELETIKGVFNTCSKLIGVERGAYQHDSLTHVEGLEEHESTLYLHIDLSGSYWYKRFLWESTHNYDYVIGDSMLGAISNTESARLCDYSGDDSQERRQAFITPSYHSEDFKHDWITAPSASGYDCAFTTDSELTVKGWAQDKPASCGQIAHALLLIHAYSVYMHFDFNTGCTITAPIGIQALWFDYMLTVANQEITVCEECGTPIIETRKPRRDKRRFCSDKCRVRNNRKKHRLKNQEIARLTGRGDKE